MFLGFSVISLSELSDVLITGNQISRISSSTIDVDDILSDEDSRGALELGIALGLSEYGNRQGIEAGTASSTEGHGFTWAQGTATVDVVNNTLVALEEQINIVSNPEAEGGVRQAVHRPVGGGCDGSRPGYYCMMSWRGSLSGLERFCGEAPALDAP